MDRFRDFFRSLKRHPQLSLLVLVLLGTIGLGVYSAGLYTWAYYNYWDAQRALARRDFAQARLRLERCLQVWSNSADTHFLMAQTARRSGAYDDAERHLNTCRQLQGVPEAIELEQYLLRAQRGDLSRVEAYLWACIQKDHPDKLLILEALSQGYLKTYNLPGAVDCLSRWLQMQPNQLQALIWRGQTLERLRQPDDALEDYRQALALDPDAEEARLRLADLLTDSHHGKEALEHYDYLRQRHVANSKVLLGLARCRRQLGQSEEARQALEELLAEEPNDFAALAERGRLALEAGDPAAAEEWLRKSLAIAPYERETNHIFLQCLHRRGKKQEADACQARLEEINQDLRRLVEVTRDIPRSPHDPARRCEAGVIMLRNGQDKEGLRWLESALQEDPRHAETHRVLADYYERTGQADLAQHHRQLALQGPG
jgi:tetratricopeptide (TPR) repeat protein